MLLHYLGKLNIQIFCRYERKRKQIAFLIASNWLRIIFSYHYSFILTNSYDQFVAPEIRHSRRHCSVCQQSILYSAAPRWDLVEHSADSHQRCHWQLGATTTRLRQSKGTSLRALADAVTNRLFSEPPNATTQQPALVRATHILSKKIAMPAYA